MDALYKAIVEALARRGQQERDRRDSWERSLKPTQYLGKNLFQEMGGQPLEGRYLGQVGLTPGQFVPNIGRNPNKPVIPGLPNPVQTIEEDPIVLPIPYLVYLESKENRNPDVADRNFPDYNVYYVRNRTRIALGEIPVYQWRKLNKLGAFGSSEYSNVRDGIKPSGIATRTDSGSGNSVSSSLGELLITVEGDSNTTGLWKARSVRIHFVMDTPEYVNDPGCDGTLGFFCVWAGGTGSDTFDYALDYRSQDIEFEGSSFGYGDYSELNGIPASFKEFGDNFYSGNYSVGFENFNFGFQQGPTNVSFTDGECIFSVNHIAWVYEPKVDTDWDGWVVWIKVTELSQDLKSGNSSPLRFGAAEFRQETFFGIKGNGSEVLESRIYAARFGGYLSGYTDKYAFVSEEGLLSFDLYDQLVFGTDVIEPEDFLDTFDSEKLVEDSEDLFYQYRFDRLKWGYNSPTDVDRPIYTKTNSPYPHITDKSLIKVKSERTGQLINFDDRFPTGGLIGGTTR